MIYYPVIGWCFYLPPVIGWCLIYLLWLADVFIYPLVIGGYLYLPLCDWLMSSFTSLWLADVMIYPCDWLMSWIPLCDWLMFFLPPCDWLMSWFTSVIGWRSLHVLFAAIIIPGLPSIPAAEISTIFYQKSDTSFQIRKVN